jgi:hypothetical protein
MAAQLHGDMSNERMPCGIELRPFPAIAFKAAVRSMAPSKTPALSAYRAVKAEDEAHDCGGYVEVGVSGNAERLNPSTDRFQDSQHRILDETR